MLILGIDPGYAIAGFGLVEARQGKYRMTACGAINTPAGVRLSARLWQIATDLENLIEQFHPDVMAIEELLQSFPGEASGGGLWQGGKTAGDGYDQAAFKPECGA